jgi:hypothetical protein
MNEMDQKISNVPIFKAMPQFFTIFIAIATYHLQCHGLPLTSEPNPDYSINAPPQVFLGASIAVNIR